ncbi:MAG TPA: hypothetical protein VFT38_16630 [Vicinamibacteria bacterium]|nr:hypothetical protein [Vicinamibacteria bacterium]
MLRNFGISLLLFGLLAAGIDGFRIRERVRNSPTSSATTSADDPGVHMAEATTSIPPR